MKTQRMKIVSRTPEQETAHHKKMRVWKHNSFRGHCSMMLAQLQGILRSNSITPEARNAAEKALTEIDSLAFNLEKRID
jgi:predicted RNA binding protein with dsRBD fold (UPF0201 family)